MTDSVDSALYSDDMQKLASAAREKIAAAERAYVAQVFTKTVDELIQNPDARTTITVRAKETLIDMLLHMFKEAGVWAQLSHTTECGKYIDSEAHCSCSGRYEVVYEVSITRNLPS